MSTPDRSIKPSRFHIVPVINCEGLWVILEVMVCLMLDLMLQYWYRRDGRWPKVTKMAGKPKILL